MNDTAIELSGYRLKKAKDLLKQAEVLLEHQGYDGSINRSYYAIFNAVRALLALLNLDSQRHSGVIAYFDRYFIKTGICEKLLSKIVHDAFDVRQVSDYEDFAAPTLEQAQQQFDNATTLIGQLEQVQASLIQGKVSIPTIS
ncbi:HEPN domain-containing protein [Candidatus Amarolinea aalborgensis]|jgi:uncharacterized protein (UPF0332 family)|uniref:HEPN domain-containing protein n=1 Tax=Candidatus Amarolinea aalborgensis TaxID=2249329 RepID=UPI003BF9C5D3